ncbi:hypothetical protein MMC06_006704, partial [Schaereria dolodes]|nr:hypothetical protein [Schaereria dolodes]
MAVATLPALLSTLTDSLTSADNSIPEASSAATPADGISLLDTKNELLLSYIQNLVFLIILKLRNQSVSEPHKSENGTQGASSVDLQDQVVKKLVELRVYIEKGVRPLESRLKYQIDKVLRAAADAARKDAQKSHGNATATKKLNGTHDSVTSRSGNSSERSEA